MVYTSADESIKAEQVRRLVKMASLGRITLGVVIFIAFMNVWRAYHTEHVTAPLMQRTALACGVPVASVGPLKKGVVAGAQ